MLKAHNKKDVGIGELGNLRRLVYFVAVVETGSFTAAADRLGITKAVVSQQVSRLEKEFRTSLLVRTTRKVIPTESGQAFYQRCTRILHEAENAFSELSASTEEPSGTLRLTAPAAYGTSIVIPAIAEFSRRYPKCKVEALLSDQQLDLMNENIELSIRAGWLMESSAQTRQIGSFQQLLVASSAMQSQVVGIATPSDLENLPFIANTALSDPLQWNFSHTDNGCCSVKVRASIYLDDTRAVLEAVREGAGVSILPDQMIKDDLANGRLIRILPEWRLPTGDIYAAFPSARFRPAKVRAFVEVLINQEKLRNAISDLQR